MARPDKGRKRIWRFRLNEGTILEVSAPEGPTEKQVRRRGRVALVLGTLVAALMVSAVAGGAIWTDQQDYTPGSVVTISGDNSDGAGYVDGHTVDVAVSGPNSWTASCSATVASGGSWSCTVTLDPDPAVAVGDYSYAAMSTNSEGNPISESGTFTDAINLKIAGTDGNLHELTGANARTNEQDLGSATLGSHLVLSGSQCSTLTYTGLKVSATGVGTGTQSFAIGYGTPSGDTNDNATLSGRTTLTETSGSVTGSSDSDCVGLDINTTGLTAGTTYHGTLQATGSGAGSGHYLFKFTVSAVPSNNTPVVTADDDSFSEGTSKSYSAGWTDTGGSAQTHTCTVDFGDGSATVAGTVSPAQPSGSGTCSASHTYADGLNSYTITVNVSDGTASGSDTGMATVANVAPTIELTGAASVNEGSAYTIGLGNVVDPGTDTVSACGIDWGDGSAAQSCLANIGSTKTHTYADGPNNYTITVDLTDEDGTFASAGTKSVQVNNVAPTVVAGFGAAVDCRVAATLNIDPDDAGVNDSPWTVNIDWGDGTTEPEISRTSLDSFTVTHTYTAAGPYNATVTVEDKDGDSGSDLTNPITVNQTYTVDFLPPFDDSNPSGLTVNKMKSGRVVPVKAMIYDDCALSFVTDPNADVTIKTSKTSGTGTGDPIEEYADAGQSSAGTNQFRFSDGYWIYNLDSKALGLVVNNLYRIDIYVGSVKATRDEWAVLQPVK